MAFLPAFRSALGVVSHGLRDTFDGTSLIARASARELALELIGRAELTGLNVAIECQDSARPAISRACTVAAAAMGTLPRRTTLTIRPAQEMGCPKMRCAPGRTRTDTSDPFRGAASALGLRGLANNTPQICIIDRADIFGPQVRLSRFIGLAINGQWVRSVTPTGTTLTLRNRVTY